MQIKGRGINDSAVPFYDRSGRSNVNCGAFRSHFTCECGQSKALRHHGAPSIVLANARSLIRPRASCGLKIRARTRAQPSTRSCFWTPCLLRERRNPPKPRALSRRPSARSRAPPRYALSGSDRDAFEPSHPSRALAAALSIARRAAHKAPYACASRQGARSTRDGSPAARPQQLRPSR